MAQILTKQAFTTETRLDKRLCGKLIEYFNLYRHDYGIMERFIWHFIVQNKGQYNKSQLNTMLQGKFGILKRTAGSLINEIQGRYNALRELKKVEQEQLAAKIQALEAQIAELVKKVSELALKAAKNELTEKELQGYRKKKASLFYKRQKLNKFKNRYAQRKKDIENGVYKLGFGTKKLFQAQYHLNANGYRSHQGWHNELVRRRDCNIFYLGEKDRPARNQMFQLESLGDGRFTIRVRKDGRYVSDNPKADDKYITGICKFKYLHEEIEEALKEKDRPLSYRIVFRGNKVYLQAMFFLNKDKRPIRTTTFYGAIGLDFNDGHIDLSETDKHGNLVHMAQFPLEFHGTGGKAENEMRTVVSGIGKYALSVGKSIVKESLSFMKKKALTLPAKSKRGKKYNRMIHTLDYSRYHDCLISMGERCGVDIIEVNPAYTSKIARQKYCPQRKLKIHNGAAFVIARRGQGFKDRYKKIKKAA